MATAPAHRRLAHVCRHLQPIRVAADSTDLAPADDSGVVTIRPPNFRRGSATLIMMHGYGDTGAGMYELGSALAAALPHINVVLPTAPIDADMTNSWFSPTVSDNAAADADAGAGAEAADEQGVHGEGVLSGAVERIHELIAAEVAAGLPHSRILLGGFSQGGLVALAAALGWAPDNDGSEALGGVFALSTAIPQRLSPPLGVSRCGKHTPVLLCHGEEDPSVPVSAFESTLRTLSIFLRDDPTMLTARLYEGLEHRVNELELGEIIEWLTGRLPPLTPKEADAAATAQEEAAGGAGAGAGAEEGGDHLDSQWLSPQAGEAAVGDDGDDDWDDEDDAFDALGASWLEAAGFSEEAADFNEEDPPPQPLPPPPPSLLPPPAPKPPPPPAPATPEAPPEEAVAGRGVDEELASFLAAAQLDSEDDGYLGALSEEGVVAEDLPHITEEDLVEMGMTKRMHRKRFLRHTAKLLPDRLVL